MSRLVASLAAPSRSPNTTNRLATIATRQRRTRLRDFLFAASVALAAVISVSALGTAAAVATTQIAPR